MCPAREIQSILSDLLSDRDDNPGNRFEVSASSSSNSIVMRGDEATVQRAIRVAQELDKSDPVRDSLRVIELKNSDAIDIVPILERLAETMAEQSAPGDLQTPGATIAHHEPTNSLVISASPDTILAMERVVEALDKRRAQVLVEAIIVEMSDNTARELGVQFLLSGTGESTVPFLSTNFSRSAPNLLVLGRRCRGSGFVWRHQSLSPRVRSVLCSGWMARQSALVAAMATRCLAPS